MRQKTYLVELCCLTSVATGQDPLCKQHLDFGLEKRRKDEIGAWRDIIVTLDRKCLKILEISRMSSATACLE